MNEMQYYLTKMAEEASEVTKIALKTSQFGMDSACPVEPEANTNRQLLHKELDDLFATIRVLNEQHGLGYELSQVGVQCKVEKMKHYIGVSASLGLVTLTPEKETPHV